MGYGFVEYIEGGWIKYTDDGQEVDGRRVSKCPECGKKTLHEALAPDGWHGYCENCGYGY